MKTILLIMIGLSSLMFADFTRLNGVVTDNKTSLEWQDDYSDNANAIKRTTWENAIDYCEALTLESGGWRLPNIKELQSILDRSKFNPSLDNTVFTKTQNSYYWSSTTYVYDSYYAWIVGFNNGYSGNYFKNVSNYVRCVR